MHPYFSLKNLGKKCALQMAKYGTKVKGNFYQWQLNLEFLWGTLHTHFQECNIYKYLLPQLCIFWIGNKQEAHFVHTKSKQVLLDHLGEISNSKIYWLAKKILESDVLNKM